jgi:tripartite-type tricarboxylate transporter receptor subunit TctC
MTKAMLPRPPTRRRLLGAGASLTALLTIPLATPAVRAQDGYPNRPVRLIVPYPPGGSADPPARLLAQRLGALWGQPVVVENRSGASGMIGAEAVARAAPDGYTIGLGNIQTHALNVAQFRRMPYDPVSDFEPIALVAATPHAIAAPATSPARTVAELAALIRRRPGSLTYGSPGPGSSAHLIAELWLRREGLNATHAAYRGAAPVVNDLLGGALGFAVSTLPGVASQAEAGRLRLLAVTSERRQPAFPDVPTFAEIGLGEAAMEAWFAILAPARTPRPIVERISRDILSILAQPDTRAALAAAGLEARDLGPEATRELIVAEGRRAVAIARAVGLEPE